MPQFRLAPAPLGLKALRLGPRMASTVILEGGAPWGFRLSGEKEYHEPIKIAKVNPNSKAYNEGIESGDYVESINGKVTRNLQHDEALNLIRQANSRLVLELSKCPSVRASPVPEIQVNGSNGVGQNNYINKLYHSADSSRSPTPALSYSNIVNQASHNPSSPSSSYPTATSGGGGGSHGNNNNLAADDNDSATDSADSQDSIIHVTGPYRGPAAAGYIQQQQQQQQQQEQQSKMAANASSDPAALASTTVWSPFGIKQVKTYKPVSFNASKAVIEGGGLQYSPSSHVTPPPSHQQQSHSVPSSPSLASRTSLTMQNSGSDAIFSDSPSSSSAMNTANFNNNARTDSPLIYQFQRQTSAPVPAPARRPNSAVPFSYGMSQQSHNTPVQGRSTPIQGQGRTTPIQGQGQGRMTPIQGQSQGRSTPVQGQGQSAPVRQSPIPGVLTSDANKNRGLSMFLRQQQRHMEPEEIAAGYSSGGEGSRPTTPVIGSPQIGRATPIQATKPNPVPTGRSTPIQIGRTTPIPGPKSNAINTGRTMPLNMPNHRPTTPTTTPPTSPMLGPKSYLGASDSMQNYSSKSPINLAAFMTPSTSTPNKTQLNNNSNNQFSSSSSSKTSWGGSSAPTTPEPALPPLPTIAPLTLIPKAPPPPPPPPSTPGSAPAGRVTPVFGSSTPIGRSGPVVGPKTTGTATPFLKDYPSFNQSQNEDDKKKAFDSPLSITTSSIQLSASSSANTPSSPTKQTNKGMWTPSQTISSPPRAAATDDEAERLRERQREEELRNTPLVWTPGEQTSDATTDNFMLKKSYKPVKVGLSQTLPRAKPKRNSPPPEETFAWKPSERSTTTATATATTTTTTSSSSANAGLNTSPSQWNGTISHFAESKSGLPPTQSATVTLLQRSRDFDSLGIDIPENIRTVKVQEGHIPKGAVYVGSEDSTEGDQQHTDSYYLLPGETKTETTTKTTEAPKYSGIGPIDPKTGMPIGFRKHVDEKNQKDWYKKIYSSLHRQEKPKKDENPYKPTYVFPEDHADSEREDRSPHHSPSRSKKVSSWSPPDASYRSQVYKVQPRSIEDYEPGLSSIAAKEKNVSPIPRKSPIMLDLKSKNELHNPPIEKPGDYTRYIDSGIKKDIRKRDRTLSPQSDVSTHDLYRQVQSGGDIPASGLQFPIPKRKERSQPQSAPAYPHGDRLSHSSDPRSPASTLDRRRRDEEAARRKQEMQRYYEEQRNKKIEKEMRQNEARRHNDIYFQKSPITPDRFEEFGGAEASGLQRPNKKVKNTVVRGKARALYTFNAQNPKELSIKRHDVMYLIRDVDRHWYECEHHGRLGIVPKSYVEVVTSLEEARTAAIQRQGLATAKYTFKAQTAVELSMNKGDTVQLIRRVDDNWLEGRRGEKQGIFPASYVEVLREPDTPLANTPAPSSFATTPVPGSPGQLSPGSTISNGPAPTIPSAPISPRTDYSTYSAASSYKHQPRETATPSPGPQRHSSSSLNVLGLSPGGHARNGYPTVVSGGGTANGRTSPYPRDNVRDTYTRKYEERINTSKPDEGLYPPYRALYAYAARATDELTLREGDIVYVMERCDDGWYVGTSQRTHEFGTFPGNYVQRC